MRRLDGPYRDTEVSAENPAKGKMQSGATGTNVSFCVPFLLSLSPLLIQSANIYGASSVLSTELYIGGETMGKQDLSLPSQNLQRSGRWKDGRVIPQIAMYKPGALSEKRDSGGGKGQMSVTVLFGGNRLRPQRFSLLSALCASLWRFPAAAQMKSSRCQMSTQGLFVCL